MNRLKGMRAYLSGPIDKAKDRGVGWRRDLTKALKEFNLVVFDPTINITNREEDDDFGTIEQLKKNGEYDKAEEYIRRHLLHTDLRLVDICDFLIVFIDPDIFVFGTVDEIATACQQRKPVLAVVNGGKLKAPNWMWGRVGYKNIFSTFDELIDYLRHVNQGGEVDHKKWLFIDYEKLNY